MDPSKTFRIFSDSRTAGEFANLFGAVYELTRFRDYFEVRRMIINSQEYRQGELRRSRLTF